jgi:small subunit ribosomal protein S4
MTKDTTSKFKACKNIIGKHKNLWGVVKSTNFRSVRILKKNTFTINQKLNRLSAFGKVLNTKQSLKRFYSIKEKLFQLLLKKATISKSKTLNKLVSFFESQIDTIFYRACFTNSLYMARQLINHGFIYLNSKSIRSKNIILNPTDILELKSQNLFFKQSFLIILKQRRFKQHYKITIKTIEQQQLSKNIIKILNDKNRNVTPILKKILAKQQLFLFKKLVKLSIISQNLETNFKLLKIIFLWDPAYKNIYYPIKIKYKKHKNSFLYSYNEILYQD